MKNLLKIGKISLLALGLCSLNSCKDYFELTENPNLVQTPPLNAMLSTATHKAAFNNYRVASFNNYYTQHLASSSPGSDTDTYQITDNSTTWDNLYYAMADLHDMMEIATESEAFHHLGVAQLLMAYQLGLVADTWGSAPYSEAFYQEPIILVPYDSEESLYQAQVDLVEKAIENLNQKEVTQSLDSNNDLLFQGDIDQWLKFSYGLQARILNKISKKSTYNAMAVLQATAKSLAANSDDVSMNTYDGINPWASVSRGNLTNNLGGWLSANFVNQLNGSTYGIEDPRVAKITEKTVHGVYVGTRNGEGNTGAANTVRDECYISYNSPLTMDNSPIDILTFAEVKLIEAEAAFRDQNKTLAYASFLAGVQANMDKLQVPKAQAEAYIKAISKGANSLTLLDIFKEKFIVTYLNAESWNDVRRFDYQYKNYALPVGAVLGKEYIRRVAYPTNELAENGMNVPAEVPLSTKLWWDQP